MNNTIRHLLSAGLLATGALSATEALAQYGYGPAPSYVTSRPYTSQLVPGYPGGVPPQRIIPYRPPVWPGMRVDYALDPEAFPDPDAPPLLHQEEEATTGWSIWGLGTRSRTTKSRWGLSFQNWLPARRAAQPSTNQ